MPEKPTTRAARILSVPLPSRDLWTLPEPRARAHLAQPATGNSATYASWVGRMSFRSWYRRLLAAVAYRGEALASASPTVPLDTSESACGKLPASPVLRDKR